MNQLKIFFACAFGAGIGTAIALQLGIFWWIGVLIGGLVGYLSYEFRAVIAAVRKVLTWRLVSIEVIKWTTLCFAALFATLLISAIPISLFFRKPDILLIILILWILYTLLYCLKACCDIKLFESASEEEMIKECKKIARMCNPHKVYFGYIPWLIYKSPRVIVLFAKFMKGFFVLIHSEIRLLCGFDAAIGVVIGYFAGNIIIGALVGGIFGILNFEILSKRILHLAPSRPRVERNKF